MSGETPTPARRRKAPPRRTIAVGDLHGDLNAFRKILTHEDLLDGDSWRGGRKILVQTGDVIDRGPASLATFKFLGDLQVRASKGQGKVVRLAGNHEVMLLEGDFSLTDFSAADKVADKLREEVLTGRVQAAFSYGGWLFTHAGVSHSLQSRLRAEMRAETERPRRFTLKRLAEHLNRKLVRAVETGCYDDPIFAVGEARGGLKDSGGGIFWADFDDELHAPPRAPRFHQVFGHTPEGYSGAQFRKTSDGRRINIDIGITDDYGGNLGYLAIEGREAVAHYLTPEGEEIQFLGEAVRPPAPVAPTTPSEPQTA